MRKNRKTGGAIGPATPYGEGLDDITCRALARTAAAAADPYGVAFATALDMHRDVLVPLLNTPPKERRAADDVATISKAIDDRLAWARSELRRMEGFPRG